MSSQQTEALRALGERWRDDPPGRCDAEDNAFRRAGLELLEALAQTAGAPPEDAPAVDGGDGRDMVPVIRWKLERAATALEARGEDCGVARDLRDMLAAAPAPAFERYPMVQVCNGCDASAPAPGPFRHNAGCRYDTTPPAEAREPVGDSDLLEDVAEALANYSIQQKHALKDRVGHELTEKLRGRFRAYRAAQPQATPREHPAAQTAGDGAREAVGRVIGPASSMSLHARLDNPLLGGTTLYAAAQGDAGTVREEMPPEFGEWFGKNYPGPDTIISDPHWHAPRIWRAAMYALTHPQGEHKGSES